MPVYYEGEINHKRKTDERGEGQDLEDNRRGDELPLDVRKIRSDDGTWLGEFILKRILRQKMIFMCPLRSWGK